MENLDNVTVTEVTCDNFYQLWSKIIEDVSSSSFIALDAEMSGLGSMKQTMKPDLEERFRAICLSADTRSVISLGLACFKYQIPKEICLNDVARNSNAAENGKNEVSDDQPTTHSLKKITFSVSIYNILLFCSDPYMIDPGAVRFLLEHGFNFNKQFSCGVPYHKGNDRESNNHSKPSMRKLFSEIIRHRKPLILHNGLTDLIFAYECFYARCPTKLMSFMADLSEMFPQGIYDTKYIAEFLDHTPASFLSYLFKYSCLRNAECFQDGKVHVNVCYDNATERTLPISMFENSSNNSSCDDICEKYAAYGWCLHGTKCPKSHNIDEIIKFHNKPKKARKRRHQSKPEMKSDASSTAVKEESFRNGDAEVQEKKINEKDVAVKSSANGHRSGIDAFMTGCIFAVFIASRCESEDLLQFTLQETESRQFSNSIPCLSEETRKSVLNKLYLSGKSMPLLVCKSTYAKTSQNHNEKLLKVYLK